MEASPPVGQARLRDSNLATVSQQIFSADEWPSRVDIAQATGLTRATVSRLVDQLEEAGFVEKLSPVRLPQQGRPASPIRPASGKIAGVGLEVNVDYVAGKAVDLSGTALTEFKMSGDFAGSNPEETLAVLGDKVGALTAELEAEGTEIAGVSLAIPGIVSSLEGDLLVAPNLGWSNLPLRRMLRENLPVAATLPLRVDNDANAQGFFAAHVRPGKLVADPNFLYLVGDRGIGGGIVIDGVVTAGESGWAGEIGHMCVEMNGRDCFCGSRGCLEKYAGVAALLSDAGLDPGTDTVSDLQLLLDEGDPAALLAIDQAGDALAVALAGAVNLLDVSQVILGTSLGLLLPWLEPELSRKTSSMLIGGESRPFQISAAPHSFLPSCTGGAFLALQRIISDPGAWMSRPGHH